MPDIKASHRKYMQHDSMSVTKMSKPNDVVFTNMCGKAIQIVTEGQIQNSRSQDHEGKGRRQDCLGRKGSTGASMPWVINVLLLKLHSGFLDVRFIPFLNNVYANHILLYT